MSKDPIDQPLRAHHPSILVVHVPPVDRGLIRSLVSPLRTTFGVPVTVYSRDDIDPSAALDPLRHQYNSSTLLASLLESMGGDAGKVLGVTGLDLFVPVLTFVFGEAQLNGTAALVSTFRLDETFYGFPPNRPLEERFTKEAVHELGHTFGLIHCRDYACVMHSSTSVEEIDVKGTELCEQCRKLLMQNR
jgi:archaemetzincin